MKQNMGLVDRVIRIVIALVVAVLYFSGIINGTVAIIALIISGVFILTALVKTCPLYIPFGINTSNNEEDSSKKD
ncbi:MAG: DUF2892 domain-containing protein [Sphingobacteriaceae bacterium]|nr:DUF2892 domain-containing protein [Sphingobacteriaceae bacterium]